MCMALIIECILNGNDKQRELALKILEDFSIELEADDNGSDN